MDEHLEVDEIVLEMWAEHFPHAPPADDVLNAMLIATEAEDTEIARGPVIYTQRIARVLGIKVRMVGFRTSQGRWTHVDEMHPIGD